MSANKLLTFLVQVNATTPAIGRSAAPSISAPCLGCIGKDADDQYHACAFNQDALLLEALKSNSKPCVNTKPYIF